MIGNLLQIHRHRPWPTPRTPWVMTQVWSDLLFAHWALPAQLVRPLVPSGLELDLFHGLAWVGVVPFQMSGVRPRLLPAVPWLSAFPELNVRTYVRCRDRGMEKAGVYFFSLDAANPAAVAIARTTFLLPYFNAAMGSQRKGASVHYHSRRTHAGAPPAAFVAHYAPAGPVQTARPGSVAHWLTERYSLYTVDRVGRPQIGEIHHVPWPLQPAQALIEANTMGAAAGMALDGPPATLHFARRLEVLVWPLRPVVP